MEATAEWLLESVVQWLQEKVPNAGQQEQVQAGSSDIGGLMCREAQVLGSRKEGALGNL